MLCEFVNFGDNICCYSITGNKIWIPNKEVSIGEVLTMLILLPLVLILISWWNIPRILIDRKKPESLGISEFLEKKRYKCGK